MQLILNYRSLGGMSYLPHKSYLNACGPFSNLFDLGFASTSQSSVSDLFRGFIFAFQDLASMNSQLFSVRLAIDMSMFF